MKPVKVLVVDDAFFMRSMLNKILEKAGMVMVAQAENGLKAIEKYKELQGTEDAVDVVLLDITMPEMNGLVALKKLIEIDKDVVVVMCSAMGYQLNVIEAIAMGAKDFIVKPFKEEEVIQKISQALKLNE